MSSYCCWDLILIGVILTDLEAIPLTTAMEIDGELHQMDLEVQQHMTTTAIGGELIVMASVDLQPTTIMEIDGELHQMDLEVQQHMTTMGIDTDYLQTVLAEGLCVIAMVGHREYLRMV